jgi:hypothetical protein
VTEGPCGADGTDKTTTSFLDMEPSLPEPLACIKYQILETYKAVKPKYCKTGIFDIKICSIKSQIKYFGWMYNNLCFM